MADNNTVTLSQLVDTVAQKTLNDLTKELREYAAVNGFRKPKKGEVLSKLMKVGAKNFSIPGYFKS